MPIYAEGQEEDFDPDGLELYGPEFMLEPQYRDEAERQAAEPLLWSGARPSEGFLHFLQESGIAVMASLLKSRLTCFAELEFEANAGGHRADANLPEWFSLEVNVLCRSAIYDRMADGVDRETTDEAVGPRFEAALAEYFKAQGGPSGIKWAVEVSSFGGG